MQLTINEVPCLPPSKLALVPSSTPPTGPEIVIKNYKIKINKILAVLVCKASLFCHANDDINDLQPSWTLKLAESRGESKNDSKGEAKGFSFFLPTPSDCLPLFP